MSALLLMGWTAEGSSDGVALSGHAIPSPSETVSASPTTVPPPPDCKEAVEFYLNYLLPGLQTRPVKIEQYADEAMIGHTAYQDLLEDLGRENNRLDHRWRGDAGAAFDDYAYVVIDWKKGTFNALLGAA